MIVHGDKDDSNLKREAKIYPQIKLVKVKKLKLFLKVKLTAYKYLGKTRNSIWYSSYKDDAPFIQERTQGCHTYVKLNRARLVPKDTRVLVLNHHNFVLNFN